MESESLSLSVLYKIFLLKTREGGKVFHKRESLGKFSNYREYQISQVLFCTFVFGFVPKMICCFVQRGFLLVKLVRSKSVDS